MTDCYICHKPVDKTVMNDYYYVYPWLGDTYTGRHIHRDGCLAEARKMHKEKDLEDPIPSYLLTPENPDNEMGGSSAGHTASGDDVVPDGSS